MKRRDFLGRGILGSLALAMPSWAQADAGSYASFRAGLRRHPQLVALRGTEQEMLSGRARIHGKWPQALRGSFYRNGPARFERAGERLEHWFDGDGMVHAWRMAEGQVQHQARMVRTHKYLAEAEAGQLLYPGFGTWLARRPFANNDTLNSANTNAVPHAGRLYALWEGGSATEIDPHSLATRGIKTWREDLAALPFSAHPKIDAAGRLWNFGALPGSNKLVLWRIEADGSLGKVAVLPVADVAMLHDFAITERYLVFLLPPFSLRSAEQTSFLDQHHWQPERPMRILVVDKADFTLKHSLEMPAAMVFHLGNAFEDGQHIRLDACLYRDARVLDEMRAHMRGEISPTPSKARTVLLDLDLARGTVSEQRLLEDGEFPRVADHDIGRRHRRLYLLGESGRNPVGMGSVLSVDLDNGQRDEYVFGPDWLVEEHVPVARPDGRGLWLLGPAFDLARQQTVLNVFDAARISAGPLAQARLPYAAPLGFHGNFLKA